MLPHTINKPTNTFFSILLSTQFFNYCTQIAAQKTVERLELTIHDINIHVEELNRQVTEISSQRSRLSSENTELMKEVQEYKLLLDNANHVKGQLAVQLEEIRRRLEDEERVSALISKFKVIILERQITCMRRFDL